MVHQQPRNTLARVEALEALVAWAGGDPEDSFGGGNPAVIAAGMAQDKTLRHVAAIWRYHEDYDPGWRP
jgi:hypothetical protein